jgi:conjugative transfer region protein TrbK
MTEPRPRLTRRRRRARDAWHALALAGIAIGVAAAAVIGLSDDEQPTSKYVVEQLPAQPAAKADGEAGELARCRSVTDVEDGACQRLWEERRQRFLGHPDTSAEGQ